jgi:hypothetical protein
MREMKNAYTISDEKALQIPRREDNIKVDLKQDLRM